MTKKDFEFIAQVIKYARIDESNRERIADDFAAALKMNNPKFNAATFKKAATA